LYLTTAAKSFNFLPYLVLTMVRIKKYRNISLNPVLLRGIVTNVTCRRNTFPYF